MVIREVALDRDVRAPRLLPSAPQILSGYGLRRTVSVIALLAIDNGCFVAGAILVRLVSGREGLDPRIGLPWWSLSTAFVVISVAAALNGLYGRRYARRSVRRLLRSWAGAFIITLVLVLIIDPPGIGAPYILTWLLAGVLTTGGRYVYDTAISTAYGAQGDAPPALVLGSLDSCLSALTILATFPPSSAVKVLGLLAPASGPDEEKSVGDSPRVMGPPDNLRAALVATGAAQVIIADPMAVNGQLQTIMDVCRANRVALKVLSGRLPQDAPAVSYIPGLDCPLFVVRPRPAGAGSYLVKQGLDLTASVFALIVLSPLLVAIALLIKVTSRGPVLFVDKRVGTGQRVFHFYKFRTMVRDAAESQGALEHLNEADGVLFKVREDPRITCVGRVLRRLSLDELPQLFNVLGRNMSLVGPRPLPLRDNERMQEWHRRRYVMMPGITGLWQIGGRSDLTFDDMVRLDMQYMEAWSLKSDLYILWRTVGAVLRSRGAY